MGKNFTQISVCTKCRVRQDNYSSNSRFCEYCGYKTKYPKYVNEQVTIAIKDAPDIGKKFEEPEDPELAALKKTIQKEMKRFNEHRHPAQPPPPPPNTDERLRPHHEVRPNSHKIFPRGEEGRSDRFGADPKARGKQERVIDDGRKKRVFEDNKPVGWGALVAHAVICSAAGAAIHFFAAAMGWW
jgi:hypothetical protein